MDESVLLVLSLLFAITTVAALVYYKQLRKAQREYERAKATVEDIVLSFNRQFKREDEKIETLGYRVEAAASKASTSLGSTQELGRRIILLEEKLSAELESRQKIIARMDEFDKALRDVVVSQETVQTKIANIESQAKQLAAMPDTSLEAVIPIRREKAMSQLTETEVSVLELLTSDGPKTAPEIKQRVRLSREHTARLMKKLYEEGYLDRETAKIPFKYSVKKEMEKLLRRTENQPP